MKLSALIQGAPGLEVRGAEDPEITGLTADSRKVKPGFVFAALKGVQADGAAFIPQALEAGAAVILRAADGAVEGSGVTVLAQEPRLALAHLAGRFYPRVPHTIAAVTGTNGKTSTVEFLRQLWASVGREAASLGTLGVTRADGARVDLGHTTPDPVAVHASLQALADEGVTHLAMEASSHGLDQRRMDAVEIHAAAFTNLTQDHLDYHATFEDYFAAKLRLFTEVARADATAVITVDSAYGEQVRAASKARGLNVVSVGWRGDDIRLREVTPRAASQDLDLLIQGREYAVNLPLVGEFQALNALQALGLAMATGVDVEHAVAGLSQLQGVRGRMQLAGTTHQGAPVFVDYAHTPDGLEKLLRALRPHTRGRVVVVFGCGGDRDPTKRRPMGEAAARLADHAIVTDDNPRTEDPAAIRMAVMEGCPDAQNIGDRAAAIRAGVAALSPMDALVIAGKGHETGQIFADHTAPFDDVEHARAALAEQAQTAP